MAACKSGSRHGRVSRDGGGESLRVPPPERIAGSFQTHGSTRQTNAYSTAGTSVSKMHQPEPAHLPLGLAPRAVTEAPALPAMVGLPALRSATCGSLKREGRCRLGKRAGMGPETVQRMHAHTALHCRGDPSGGKSKPNQLPHTHSAGQSTRTHQLLQGLRTIERCQMAMHTH